MGTTDSESTNNSGIQAKVEAAYQSDMARRERWFAECRETYRTYWRGSPDGQAYDYLVFLTRRSMNLNEYFCCQDASEGREEYETLHGEFISQNALMCYAPKIAGAYRQTGRFPRILLVDEVLFHGREIMGFLRQFEQVVFDKLQEGPVEKEDYAAFLRAVHIGYFMRLRDAVPVSKRYALCVLPDGPGREASIQDCRLFTQTVVEKLTQADNTDNTSYIPFFRLSEDQYKKLSDNLSDNTRSGGPWSKTTWTYAHLKDTEIWQPNPERFGPAIRFQWTLRAHRDKSGGHFRVIILPLFSEMPRQIILRLNTQIADELKVSGKEFTHFVHLMQENNEQFKPVQVLFILFLLSIIKFYELAEDADIGYDPDANKWFPYEKSPHDLDKISRNFGKAEDTLNAVRFLCGTGGASRKLRKRLREILDSYQQHLVSFWNVPEKRGIRCENKQFYLQKAENFFYSISQKVEDRFTASRAAGVYDRFGLKTDLYSFVNGYFAQFSDYTNFGRYSLSYSIAALLMMMDAGVASMVPRLDPLQQDHENGCSVQNMLRSDENALSTLPRRYVRFLPALILLESRSQHLNLYPWEIAEQFGEYLDRDSAEERQTNYAMLFRSFVYRLYANSQQLGRWNMNLISGLDQPNRATGVRMLEDWSLQERSEAEWCEIEQCNTIKKYELYERRKQEEYLSKAKKFLAERYLQ